jgi:hypothetical protein
MRARHLPGLGWTCTRILLACTVLASCAGPAPGPAPGLQAQTAAAAPEAVYVVLGAGGRASARALVAAAQCPTLLADGAQYPMQTRSEPGTAPLRPHQGKPADFPLRVCEAALPAGVHAASAGGRALPLPAASAQRIVVLGDTGCRIKQADHAYQDCSDAAAWPFRAVADAAAREHPDLVVHVGDYHYRENLCPPDAGCAGSPWGYGWDAWNADFFQPAQAAPADAQRRCDAPERDGEADFSEPYAVPLGGNWQLIVFDSARASKPLDLERPADARAYAHYLQNMDTLAALAAIPGTHSIFVSHHPVLGFGMDSAQLPVFGTPALLAPMAERFGPRYFPPGVELSLHGHVHTFEAIGFRSAHPPALVTGHGGDKLDAEVPSTLALEYPSAPGVQIDFVAHAGGFGYLVLDRTAQGWQIRAQGVDGQVQARCTLVDAHLDCPGHGALSRPQTDAR